MQDTFLCFWTTEKATGHTKGTERKEKTQKSVKSRKSSNQSTEANLTLDKLLRPHKAEIPRVAFGKVYMILCENGRSGKFSASEKVGSVIHKRCFD